VVRVLEGSLTTDQLAVELDKLLPGNSWVIEEKGNDAFITNFPFAEVLSHMVNWGPMDTKTAKGKIRFEKGAKMMFLNMRLTRFGCSSGASQRNYENFLLSRQLVQF
jgi:hypothetical protein